MNRSSGRADIRRNFGDLLKHEARLKLWLPSLIQLRNSLERPLKYFTLSGPKAYDVIRWKQEDLIDFDGRKYPGVCFCDYDEENYSNARGILNNTNGINAEFENIMLCENREQEYEAFWELFPYDVYNLDFCGTCFERDGKPVSDTFLSITELIDSHIRSRGSEKCLVFLTIKIDRGRTNEGVLADLERILRNNIQDQEIGARIVQATGRDVDAFIRDSFHYFMLSTVPKLLASRVVQQVDRTLTGRLGELSRAYYSRNGYYIGKFVFSVGRENITSVMPLRSSWYTDLVYSAFDMVPINNIRMDRISRNTEQDFEKLKAEIDRIESLD